MSAPTARSDSARFSWRIRAVLVVVMALLVLLSIGSLTVIEAVREQSRYREQLVDRASLLADVLSQLLADVLYFDNVEGARHLAEIVDAMPEVRRYQVFNASGRILVDSQAAKYGSGTVDPELLAAALERRAAAVRRPDETRVVAPIAVGGEVLGGVAVAVDTAAVAPHVRVIISERLRYGVIAIAGGIIVALVLGYRLTTPIRELIIAARRVAAGDLSFSSASTRSDEMGDLVGAFEDMVLELREQERKDAEERTAQLERTNALLRQHAMEDALTGLPNRRLLLDRFTVAKAKAKRSAEKLALLFLDLDQFKIINDSLGHAAGDEVLLEIARRLKAMVRAGDTVARLGGDEFIVLASGLEKREQSALIAEKILEAIHDPLTVGGRQFRLTASVGISLYPDDGASVEELQRNADLAMYRAKSFGRNRFQFFDREMESLAADKLELERDIQRALAEGEFTAYFQPIVDLATGEIAAAEALIRWRHPQRGLMKAGDFVPLLELTGRMDALDSFVLEQASSFMKTLSERYGVKLAVNLSAQHFMRPTLLEDIRGVLGTTGFDPALLEIEITETAAIAHDRTTEATFQALADLGVSISIDDFGTGYASLTYLRHLPVSKVKIDREFVRGLPGSVSDAAIIESVVALAHNLGIRVTAEGVEDEEQHAFVVQLGCDELQGDWFEPALEPSAFEALLARRAPGRAAGT